MLHKFPLLYPYFYLVAGHWNSLQRAKELAKAVALPCMIFIVAEQDREVPPQHGRALQKLFPASSLIEVANVGHNKCYTGDQYFDYVEKLCL